MARIFAEDGEPAFRALEHQVIAELLDGPDTIIALGGGAAEHPGTQHKLGASPAARVVTSRSATIRRCCGSARTRAARCWPGRTSPPSTSAGGSVYTRLAALTVGTDDRHPETVGDDILAQLALPPPLARSVGLAAMTVTTATLLLVARAGPGRCDRMRIGMFLSYAGGFAETVVELADYEKAGLDIVFVPEAYSFDAVSQLGFIAAKTERMQIGSGILPLYSRTPALTAMTAAGLDFRLGRPVHARAWRVRPAGHRGLARGAPTTRRSAGPVRSSRSAGWSGAASSWTTKGRYYQLPPARGTGLGKPLKLINHPVRERIPIALAAIGPKNVELAAELAESWMPIFYLPEKAGQAWGGAVAEGTARRDPGARPAGRDRARAAGDRRGRHRAARSRPAPSWPCTSAGWGPGAGTSTTTWPAGSVTQARPRRSRTPTWTAVRPRPSPWCPRSWWSGPP